jgi:hypothetical protein
LTNITAIFGNAPEKPAETSEKLRDLYWNRAELKKELAGLRDEKFQLQECVKQKEGASARLLQKFEHLENLLLDSESVYNVIVYYQFRSLNLQCKSKLANFAEHLKQQRERRLNISLHADWNESRKLEADSVERSIGEQRLKVQMLEDQLQSERHKLLSSNGLVKVFRRRSLERASESVAEALDAAQQLECDLMMKFDEIQKRRPPETQGLDLATKRLINFMVLSFSQHMFLHYSDDGLAAMSQEAGEKSAGAINYGTKADCDALLLRITSREEEFEKLSDFAEILQQRAKLIAQKALFQNEDDAIPTPGTVTTLFAFDRNGVIKEKQANLLGDNYWDVSKILSR